MTLIKILLLRVAKKMEWFENGPSVSINQSAVRTFAAFTCKIGNWKDCGLAYEKKKILSLSSNTTTLLKLNL
jgi:hypothetical protein